MPSRRRSLLVLVLLTTILKLAIAAAPRPDLFGPGSADEPHTYHPEELSRGDIAVEILDGPLLPILDYQWEPFFGGALVEGLLAVPLFALFGPRMFVLKLVPIAFNAVAVAFLFLVLDRAAGRRAAWIGGLLMALGPPGYAATTTVAWGVHAELNAFVLISLYLFLGFWTGRSDGLSRRFLFGLTAGFAIYFGYGYLAVLATLALFALTRGPRFWWRASSAAGACGFLIGLSPWITYNLAHDFEGLRVYGVAPAAHFALSETLLVAPGRTVALLSEVLPRSLFFRDFGPLRGTWIGTFAALVLYALFLVGSWNLWRSPALRPARIFAVHPLIFVAVFVCSDFFPKREPRGSLDYRYAQYLYPFLFLAAGVALDFLLSAGRRSAVLAGCAGALLAGLFLWGSLDLVDHRQFGVHWQQPANSRSGHGRWLVMHYAGNRDLLEQVVARATTRRTAEAQEELYRGMGGTLRYLLGPQAVLNERDRQRIEDYRHTREWLYESVPAAYRQHFR